MASMHRTFFEGQMDPILQFTIAGKLGCSKKKGNIEISVVQTKN